MENKSRKKRTGRVIVSVIVLLLLAGAGAFALQWFHRSDPGDTIRYETTNVYISQTTLVSAHRSGGGIMPEETMMAFRNCVENSAAAVDIFEFDVRITKDDALILLHDVTLDRTSDCEEVFGETDVRPENKTLAELRRLNMGAKFTTDDGRMPFAGLAPDEVPDEIRIATLDEVLDYLESQGSYRYVIEIKNEDDLGRKALAILYDTLVKRDMMERVILGTFHPEVAAYADEHYPDLARGANPDECVEFLKAMLLGSDSFAPKYKVLQLPFHDFKESKGINLGISEVINFAHAYNLAVQYWTINNEKDARYLISIGADCVMSDYPDMVNRVKAEMAP